MADESKKNSKRSDEDILAEAHERFKLAEEAWTKIHNDALDDLKFSAGDQWHPEIKAKREKDGRPCITVNRAPQFIRQITNEQRQNRPSIKVSPVDDLGDPEVARILQGMTRHIEYDSNADVAYDTAFDGAVRKSFGFWRVITEYVSPRSFEQQLKIKSIRNAFSVLLDPTFKEPDASDMNYGFVVEDIPHDVYKADYKDSKLAESNDWTSFGNTAPGWVSATTCRVAEYFTKEFEEIEIFLTQNGSVVSKDEYYKQFPDGSIVPPEYKIKDKRKSVEPVVKWYKLGAIDILDRTDWLGIWIPIVPAFGDLVDIEGELTIESVIRHSKESQKMLNLFVSAEAEAIGLMPKAPWIVAEGQTEAYEREWATANTQTHAKLTYTPVSIEGVPVGAPQRNTYEAPVQAITNARAQASEDLKATTGIYDSALGARSNETSGIAIRGRQQQAQTSNFHFIDNLTRSIRHTGRILVDLIPKIYDTPRIARIIGEEGQEEVIKINQSFKYKGEEKTFDLSVGKYDVTVETGPNYQTKRQEAVASMLEFMKIMPQHAGLVVDLMVGNMDFPGSSELKERLKKSLPPGIADDKDKPPIPPEVQQQMQAMGQQLEQLNAVASEQQKMIDTKILELESKERIEMMKLENAIALKQMDLVPQESMAIVQHELADIHARLNLIGINQPIQEDQNQNQNFNGVGPDQALMPQEQPQPSGGFPPG